MFGSIGEWWKQKKIEAKKKRKSKLRHQLLKIVRKMKATDNRGLMRKYLMELPGVQRLDTESGGFQRAYVDVRMSDDYEITASDVWLSDALRKAMARVIERIREIEF